MRKILVVFLCIHTLFPTNLLAVDFKDGNVDILNKLTPKEEDVIVNKNTEQPYSGKYLNFNKQGVFVCKRCNAPLYRSEDKFNANYGWPSFDDDINGAIYKSLNYDGERTEIMCAKCNAHLGYLYLGEGHTPTDVRHCVNSISLNFIPKELIMKDTRKVAYFASGCFWGVEYHFNRRQGVLETTVGYMGGKTLDPTYDNVKTGETDHAETIEIVYDPKKVSYEGLVKFFFETHDFTQVNRQGPDVGTQYRSVIFYKNEEQKSIAEECKNLLIEKGHKVATEILPAPEYFWRAENMHQNYYDKKGGIPYCHVYKRIF